MMDIANDTNITSPGFPTSYTNNLDCRWIFTSPKDTTMKINTLNFTIADGFDLVTFVDGDSKNKRLIQTFSKDSRPGKCSTSCSIFFKYTNDYVNKFYCV